MRMNVFGSAMAATSIGAFVGRLLFSISGFAGEVDSFTKFFLSAAAIMFYGFILALPFVFLYGMPLYAVLKRIGRVNVLIGMAIGALPGMAWLIWTKESWFNPVLLNGAIIGGVYVLMRHRFSQP